MAERPLKAFICDPHDYEGRQTVEFTETAGQAKRRCAGDFWVEFTEVSVRRAPQFDKYGPGPVPVEALLANGWWFACSNCGERLAEEGPMDDDEWEGDSKPPLVVGRRVFCDGTCRDSFERIWNADGTTKQVSNAD